MIIELAKEFANFSEAEWQPYHEAIENLLLAHRQGWHLFAPARKISDSIHSSCELSRTQRAILDNYVREKFAVLVGQAKSAERTILAVADDRPVTPERNNQIAVPLGVFKDPQAAMPTRLLTENSEIDGQYLEWIARATAKKLGISNCINIELLHGGGSTMATELRRRWSDTRPLICVADSDRRYPNAALGDTAKAILAIGNINGTKTVVAHILEVREAENLIPVSILFDVYKGNYDVLKSVGKIHNYLAHKECKQSKVCVCDYFDFKDGISYGDVATMPEPAKSEFMKFCRHISTEPLQPINFDDASEKKKICSGVSKYMLRNTVDFIKRSRKAELEFAVKLMRAPFWANLEPVIREILCFSIASERLPIS